MKRRSLPIVVGTILVAVAILLFLPGSKSKRLEKADREVLTTIALEGGRMATEAEVATVANAKSFLFQKVEGAPTIYLFVPSLNVNIALLARGGVSPNLDGFNIVIAPQAAPESQTTEKAVGMCLIKTSEWTIANLRQCAGNIRPSMKMIDEKWSKFNDGQRTSIKDAQKVNSDLVMALGGLPIAIVVGKRGYLLKNWTTASNLRNILDTLQKG